MTANGCGDGRVESGGNVTGRPGGWSRGRRDEQCERDGRADFHLFISSVDDRQSVEWNRWCAALVAAE